MNLVRNGKRQYFESLASADNKKFWKSVKLLNKIRETIPTLQYGDCIPSTDKEKADMLNTFFASYWNSQNFSYLRKLTVTSPHNYDLEVII